MEVLKILAKKGELVGLVEEVRGSPENCVSLVAPLLDQQFVLLIMSEAIVCW